MNILHRVFDVSLQYLLDIVLFSRLPFFRSFFRSFSFFGLSLSVFPFVWFLRIYSLLIWNLLFVLKNHYFLNSLPFINVSCHFCMKDMRLFLLSFFLSFRFFSLPTFFLPIFMNHRITCIIYIHNLRWSVCYHIISNATTRWITIAE